MLLISIIGNGVAQSIPSSVIDINNVRGTVLGIGSSYSSILGNELTWEVPKGSGNSPLFQYSLWLGGKDINDQIHVAANLYNQNGRDYWMGPLMLNYAQTNAMVEYSYEYIWNVTREQIDDFIANHGQPGYVIPNDILTWPAHGDASMGFASNLAPFVDVNGDGHYDAEDGDYPDILGDQCLYFIFNDKRSHTESNGEDLGIEVQAMVYAYDAPSDDILDNTVFFHYDIINRSTMTYPQFYVGIWNDWNIGYAQDDYAGCNVRLGACYGYNSSAVDGNGEPGTYGDNPPVQLCSLLAGPYKAGNGLDDVSYAGDCNGYDSYFYMGYDNGIVDDERLGLYRFFVQSDEIVNMGDPENAQQIYRMFQGYWKDGERVQFGGNGYPGGDGVVGPNCNFMFPLDTDPCNFGTNGILPNGGYNVGNLFWSESISNNNPGDRKGLAVTGPFYFRPDMSQPLDFAFTTVWETDTQSALDRIEEAVLAVREKFENEQYWSVAERPWKEDRLLRVYPNPSTGPVMLEGTGQYTVTNTFGQRIAMGDINGETTLVLPTGLYFVRLENGKGSCVRKIIVK